MVESSSAPIPSKERRRHDLDALRGFAMLLGIGLHASLAFFPAPWWVQDRTSGYEGLFDEFLWAVHGFRMPVFFLMSGFFTALLWRRRGLGALLNHRLRRVALPLLISLLTIVPLTTLVGGWAAESAPAPQVADDDIWGKVFAGDVSGVEELLDEGFDVDLRGEPGGWTLLHGAAFTGHTGMLQLLLSRGADPDPVATASEGETPLGVAFHFGHEEAADLLVSYGGGEPLPEGIEWSEIPGWGAGAAEQDEGNGSEGALDLSTIQRFYHLWFLWFLLWLVAGFALVAWVVDRRASHRTGRANWPRWLMWSMVPLTIVPQLSMGEGGAYPVFGPDTSDGLVPLPHVLAYYATFFTFGALMYRREGRTGTPLVDTVGRPWWLFLPVSFLIVLPAGLAFTFEAGDLLVAGGVGSPSALRMGDVLRPDRVVPSVASSGTSGRPLPLRLLVLDVPRPPSGGGACAGDCAGLEPSGGSQVSDDLGPGDGVSPYELPVPGPLHPDRNDVEREEGPPPYPHRADSSQVATRVMWSSIGGIRETV